MIAFAWLIAMVLVGYVVYQWAMSATTRFLRLAVDRGLIQPAYKGHYRSDPLFGVPIQTGQWLGRLRAIITPSTDTEIEAARKAAVFRWVLAPFMVTATALATWSGLIALTH